MPRTIHQAMQDIDLILSWWRHIPTTPTTHAASIEHHTPTTNNEDRLPFGLDARFDDLDDGPTGIHTSLGAHHHLQHLAYWMWTSNYPSSLPDYRKPGAWIRLMLDTPYPWETWGTDLHGNAGGEWDEWAEDLHTTKKVLAKLTGNHAQTGPTCPNGHTTWTNDTETYKCSCGTWTDTELPEARRHTLQSPDLPDTVHVTGAQAIAIWPDVLDHDTLRDWVRHGRIQPTSDTPRQYPLAILNTLTTALAHKRNT